MSSSNLKWVYGPTHRAQDVSNEAVDEYKNIIQQLYLDQNMTREEVLTHLQDVHGFSLSGNQFSKATKRWGFYKQPRQTRTSGQPPESIIEEAAAPNSLNPPEGLFDFDPNVPDTIDETNEACFETGGDNVADSQILDPIQGQFSPTGSHLVSEPPPSVNDWQLEAMGANFPCDALACDAVKSLPESSQGELQKLQTELQDICRKIAYKTAVQYPASWPISGKEEDADKFMRWFQSEVIWKIKRTKKLRTLIKKLDTCLSMHYAGPDIDLDEKRSLQSVQSDQRRAEDFVFGNDSDTLTQEVRQTILSHRDIWISDQHLTLLSSNPAMTRSLASGSSRGSSLNSFREFKAASRAMEICLKED